MSLSLLQYNILSLALLLPVMLNVFVWESPLVARLFGGVFFIFQWFILGQFVAKNRPFIRQIGFGFLSSITLLLISSTVVYVLWDLSKAAQIVAWLLFVGCANALILWRGDGYQTRFDIHEWRWKSFAEVKARVWLIGLYLFGLLALFATLLQAQTAQPIRSPWELVPSGFWIILFLITALLWGILWFSQAKESALILVPLHLFACLSVALIVYKLGYGYDSFIHQTTESLINASGVVLPKTPYYLGQYSLIVSLHRLVGVGIVTLDRLLLPALTAISLPLFCAEWLPKQDQSRVGLRYSHWLALTILFIPFSSFIVTTPQGLANLFFLWIVIAALPLLLQSNVPWSVPELTVIAFAALLTHPLTGVPAFVLVALIGFELVRPRLLHRPWMLPLLSAPLTIIGLTIMPVLLWIWSLRSSTVVQWRLNLSSNGIAKPFTDIFTSWFQGFMPALPTQFAYAFLGYWWLGLLVVALCVSAWLAARAKDVVLRVFVKAFLFLMVNGLLIAVLFTFPGIAAYESQAYASRLITLALWCLLPLLMLAMLWVYRLPLMKRPASACLVVCMLAAINTTAVYASYPRQNRFERSRQFSTSETDFQVVQAINDRFKSDMVVLSNQSVSAAAIASFGFRTYFPTTASDTPLFYYPVPTSSPLYNVYLSMVNDAPSRDHARAAHDLTGASNVIFVLNSYWDNAEQLRSRAKMEADESFDVGNGATSVFIYRFPKDAS